MDNLGSTTVITTGPGETLAELTRLGYDAWGRRRNASGADDSWSGLGTLQNTEDNSGFTGHDQLDTLGLVNMGARLYDPITGRHLSADPTIPDPADLQSLNRFSYVLNNALAYVDPTGLAGSPVLKDVKETLQAPEYAYESGSGEATCKFWPGAKCQIAYTAGEFQMLVTNAPGKKAAKSVEQMNAEATAWIAGLEAPKLKLGESMGPGCQGSECSQNFYSLGSMLPGPLGTGAGLKLAWDQRSLGLAVLALMPVKLGWVKGAAELGREGESAVRAAYNIGGKPGAAILMNGRARIPDGLTADVLSEVKNVKSLSFTRQLRDYSDFAQQTGRRFDLYTRQNTKLSGPLQDAIDSGLINHRYIP